MGAKNPNGGALPALCALVRLMAEPGGVATPEGLQGPSSGASPHVGRL